MPWNLKHSELVVAQAEEESVAETAEAELEEMEERGAKTATSDSGACHRFDRLYAQGSFPLDTTTKVLNFTRACKPPYFVSCSCYLPTRKLLSAVTSCQLPKYKQAVSALHQHISLIQAGCSVAGKGQLPTQMHTLGWPKLYGLGGGILSHIDSQLIPTWKQVLAAPAAVDRFNTKFLWAVRDKALGCGKWYGCYWRPLAYSSAADSTACLRMQHRAAKNTETESPELTSSKPVPSTAHWGPILEQYCQNTEMLLKLEMNVPTQAACEEHCTSQNSMSKPICGSINYHAVSKKTIVTK
jgi:hypothetical protein